MSRTGNQGRFNRVHGISEGLVEVLRENGADKAVIERLREVIT